MNVVVCGKLPASTLGDATDNPSTPAPIKSFAYHCISAPLSFAIVLDHNLYRMHHVLCGRRRSTNLRGSLPHTLSPQRHNVASMLAFAAPLGSAVAEVAKVVNFALRASMDV
jgi:hypothetical protein